MSMKVIPFKKLAFAVIFIYLLFSNFCDYFVCHRYLFIGYLLISVISLYITDNY